jgi:hypothetical protein
MRARFATLALLALSAPVAAQAELASAAKQARAACKAELSAFKAELDQAMDDAFETLEAFGNVAEGGLWSSIHADDLMATLDGTQEAVQVAAASLAQALAAAVYDALFALQPEALADGVPASLTVGNGGVLDDSLAALDKALAKAYRKLNKRIDQLEDAVAAHTSFALQVTAFPPRAPAVAATASLSDGLQAALSIDLLLSTSDLSVAGDGYLCVGGTTSGAGIDVRFEASAMEALYPTFTAVDESFAAGRAWVALADVPESAYLVAMWHEGTPTCIATAAFNVR